MTTAIVTSEGLVGSWATQVADAFGSYSLSLALMDQVAPSSEAMLAACDRVSDNLTAWYGPERNEWLSPSPDTSAPYYLTGEFPGNPSCLAAMASVKQTQGPFRMPPDHAPVPVPGVSQRAACHGLAPLLGAVGTSLASWHCTGELSPPPSLGVTSAGPHLAPSPGTVLAAPGPNMDTVAAWYNPQHNTQPAPFPAGSHAEVCGSAGDVLPKPQQGCMVPPARAARSANSLPILS